MCSSDLLNRVEMQMANKRQSSGRKRKKRKRTDCGDRPLDHTRDRALKMVKEGAYRKATTLLTGACDFLTDEENMKWAEKLHPRSSDSVGALSGSDGPPLHTDTHREDQDPVEDDNVHPLKGVRFAALKAPGPSGLRPEHLSELLGVSRRRVANRCLRALGKLLDCLERGGLTESARWLIRSRTILIPKKSGKAPMPLKVGEVFRSANAKRTLRRSMPKVTSTFTKMRQWGIGIPGGADALMH